MEVFALIGVIERSRSITSRLNCEVQVLGAIFFSEVNFEESGDE